MPQSLHAQSSHSIQRMISCLSLLIGLSAVLLWIGQPEASAKDGTIPPPAQGTYADYYVSWDNGNDANPGTKAKPFKTPTRAIDALHALPDPSGKIVLVRGGTYRLRDSTLNRIKLKNLHGKAGAPIEIRGYPGERIVLDAFQDEFDPTAVPFYMPTGWGGICFSECSYILVENFEVKGRCQCNIELLNSDFITIRYIDAKQSDTRGLFTGGSFHDLVIECCRFYEQIYGSTTSHGIYVSGGHWDPTLPPVRNVTIRYCESFFNGRHGIQLNGRIENILIEYNTLHHNILGGISLIGCRNAEVRNNVIYKNNKQGVILYTYFDDDYWDINDPESVAHWKGTHWTTKNVFVENNTIFMDDKPWYIDEWINYKPYYHAGIYMVDTSGLLPPFENIWIKNNIIHNHSKSMVNMENPEFFAGTYALSNVFLSENYVEAVGWKGGFTVKQLEKDYPTNWKGNVCGKDTRFLNLTPTEIIDASSNDLDFSDSAYTKFQDDFHLHLESPAWKPGAGAYLARYAEAHTDVNTSQKQPIPPEYGKEIAKKIFRPDVPIEIQLWFLSQFNPALDCLPLRNRSSDSERICFKDKGDKQIAFALYNQGMGPLDVKTQLTAPGKPVEYGKLLGFSFDPYLDIRALKDLKFEKGQVSCTLGMKCMAVFIVDYEEATY